MDFNHIINNHHTPTNKFSIKNLEKQQQQQGFSSTIDMNDHHHHHDDHQEDYQNYHQNVVQQHPSMALLDPVWQTYHNLPASYQTSSSYSIIKPTISSIQGQVIEHQDHELEEENEEEEEELGAMKEMMYRIAVMQPVDIDPATIRKPKRRNVRISNDPQSVAARHRRERISERIRILQRLVPGGTKMDTASMLDEAIRYVKFLKRQIRLLGSNGSGGIGGGGGGGGGGGSSNHHLTPALPALPPSDWPPPPGPFMGATSSSGNSKGVLFGSIHHHHDHEGVTFQHGGNNNQLN